MKWPWWFIRPAAIGDRAIHPNAHVPKYGYLVQHLLTETQAIVRRALERIARAIRPDNSWLSRDASLTEIVKATAYFTFSKTALARKAVRNALRALEAKHIIRCWNPDEDRPAPARYRGDGRFKTCWKILSWNDTLQAIANDARVWTPQKRTFFVVGRSKKLVTPDEAEAWKLNAKQAIENPRAWAYSAPSATDQSEPEAAPANPQKAARAGSELIKAAKRFCSRTPADSEVTQFAALCRAAAQPHGFTLSDEAIIEILGIAVARRGMRAKYFTDYLADAAGFTGLYLGGLIQNRERSA